MTTEFNLTKEGQRVHKEILEPSPDCRKCSHFDSCTIWRDMGQYVLSKFTDQKKPFSLEVTAKICEFYALDNNEDGR